MESSNVNPLSDLAIKCDALRECFELAAPDLHSKNIVLTLGCVLNDFQKAVQILENQSSGQESNQTAEIEFLLKAMLSFNRLMWDALVRASDENESFLEEGGSLVEVENSINSAREFLAIKKNQVSKSLYPW